jgi:hypothetical protein
VQENHRTKHAVRKTLEKRETGIGRRQGLGEHVRHGKIPTVEYFLEYLSTLIKGLVTEKTNHNSPIKKRIHTNVFVWLIHHPDKKGGITNANLQVDR